MEKNTRVSSSSCKGKAILMIFLALAVGLNKIQAQDWDNRFGGTTNELFKAFIVTKDNSFLLAGSSNSSATGDISQPNYGASQQSSDYWIIKIDSHGAKVWEKRFGGISDDNLIDIKETNDGGFVLGGHSASNIGGTKSEDSRGSYDYWMIKIDSLGDVTWDKTYGGSWTENFHRVYQTLDGGYLLAGESLSPADGDKTESNFLASDNNDIWLVKTDDKGNKEWDRRFGGYGFDYFGDIIQLADSGFVMVAGTECGVGGTVSQPNRDSSNETSDFWVVKIGKEGNKLWDKRYGTTGYDNANLIRRSSNGSYYVLGMAEEGYSIDKAIYPRGGWILVIDSNGAKLAERLYPEFDGIYGAQLSDNGDLLISGTSYAGQGGNKSEENIGAMQTWAIIVDANGLKMWDKTALTFDNNIGYAHLLSSDCIIFSVGTTSGIGGNKTLANWDPSNSSQDFWIMKYCHREVGISMAKEDLKLQAFPNPFTDQIVVSLQKFKGERIIIEMTNILGESIYKKCEVDIGDSLSITLNLENLPKGIYLMKIDDGQNYISKKLVKE